jgi:hypothetical protein
MAVISKLFPAPETISAQNFGHFSRSMPHQVPVKPVQTRAKDPHCGDGEMGVLRDVYDTHEPSYRVMGDNLGRGDQRATY